jgi:hypothetical protein
MREVSAGQRGSEARARGRYHGVEFAGGQGD